MELVKVFRFSGNDLLLNIVLIFIWTFSFKRSHFIPLTVFRFLKIFFILGGSKSEQEKEKGEFIRSSRPEVFRTNILQNIRENTCVVVSLRAATLLKKRLQDRCFLSFAKFLRISSFTEHLRWLLLIYSTPKCFLYQYFAAFSWNYCRILRSPQIYPSNDLKCRGLFKTVSNIDDGAFLLKLLTAPKNRLLFSQKNAS